MFLAGKQLEANRTYGEQRGTLRPLPISTSSRLSLPGTQLGAEDRQGKGHLCPRGAQSRKPFKIKSQVIDLVWIGQRWGAAQYIFGSC